MWTAPFLKLTPSSVAAMALRRPPSTAPRMDGLRNLRLQSLPLPNHASFRQTNLQQRIAIHTSASSLANHFDTHQFVEELTREGLSRQQAEGVMAALAEVVDESIAGMSRTMVTKAEQEKASSFLSAILAHSLTVVPIGTATLHAKGRFRATKVRAATPREERLDPDEARKRSTPRRRRKAQATPARGNHANDGGGAVRPEPRKGQDTRRE